MRRNEYFEKIAAVPSPLLSLIDDFDDLTSSEHCLDFANKLMQLDTRAAKTRAEFILRQCSGEVSQKHFVENCESWGIPIFDEELLVAADFTNGFLHTFRDHSTSWNEDIEARQWFYRHVEARTTKRYEFWACDDGPEELLFHETAGYKTMLWRLVTKYQEYHALISPVFSNSELKKYVDAYHPDQLGIEKDELLEFLSNNPNWRK